MEAIPDAAIVVRGGMNTPADIQRGTKIHRASGINGVSVQCATGLTLSELAEPLPHGVVGVCTVADVRTAGGEVVRTSGVDPNHATVTGLTSTVLSWLLTPVVPHPRLGQGKP